ncbi:hypothetical protein J2Y69_001435 [Microbacterium resistens]|uniref:XRE family transcriptional regulator n=1 Tax=Microbacterium resistens TaxID=156977 RepID=A0ABU1SB44_9MICO|nr:helix-turn-helix transcriptional regulator [Microbacterium resistens]MDR6866836.1 hypothetical protein [Microbacterium resistens]
MSSSSADDTSTALSPTFASALHRAIEDRKISLTEIRRRLGDAGSPVSIATLSYWRAGARRPEGAQSRVAIDELERILRLEPGELSDLMGPTRRPGHLRPPGPGFSDEELTAAVGETLAALDAAPQTSLREISSTTTAEVGADGGVRVYTTRVLLQAAAGTIQAIPVAYTVSSPEAIGSAPQPFVVSGVRLGRQHVHPSRTIIGVRLELDVPITAPETAFFEFGYRIPEAHPLERSLNHGVLRKSRELIVEARFTPDALPDWVEEVEDDEDGERVIPRTLNGTTIHAVRRGFGPGSLGLRWGYDEPE